MLAVASEVKMLEKTSNIVSHMCGYCNKIFHDEKYLDKHIEEFHFLEVLNEDYEEDGEDYTMESVEVGINVDKVKEVSEEDEIMDNVDVEINVDNVNEVHEDFEVVDPVEMILDCEENLGINVNKENSHETSVFNQQEELKQKKVIKQKTANKQKKANKQNKEKSLGNVNIKSETNYLFEEDQTANAETKKLMKREKHRLKMQRLRQRQVESGIVKEKKPRKRPLLGSKEPSSSPHRDWSPFYRREGDMMRCLGCLT